MAARDHSARASNAHKHLESGFEDDELIRDLEHLFEDEFPAVVRLLNSKAKQETRQETSESAQ